MMNVHTYIYTYEYDDEGRLIRESQTGSLDHLYAYDERGELFRSGTDVNTNGVLDPASMDRIQEQWREYVLSGGNWFLQRTSISYPFDGSAAPFTNSITRTRVGGSGCACEAGLEETVDARGNVSTRQTSVDPLSKTVTKALTRPGIANPETTVSSNGLPQSRTLPTGAEYRYLYDGLGRQTGMVDPRTGTNRTVYLSNGWVDYIEDAAGYRTTFSYDVITGRRTSVTDALTNTVYTAYDVQGRVTNTWGATYPVAYEYDTYGRMTAMKTWRDTNAAPDTTRWNYDEATGLLTNKVYADDVGPSYEYDSAGRLTKRIWARGVETDYAYDFSGQLTNIAYSDSTPDVAFTYDRLGRQLTATDALGTRTNQYDALTLLEERLPDGTVLARAHDAFGRPAGIALDADYTVGYGYDEFGRFAAIAVSNGVQFDYSYVLDSSLLVGWSVSNGAAAAYAYEPNRDLRTDVVNTFDGDPISSFAYTYDAAGRRTQRVDSGLTTNLFGYNMRSELADAIMGTNIYAYLYDTIGNRREASANEVTNVYQANELNQYNNINEGAVDPVYDADGNLIQLGPWVYSWDGENRLISVSSNGVPVMQNQYDYMSRRVMKATATQTNTFIYDAWNMVQESTVSVLQSHVSHFVWGLDLSQSLQGAGGVGGLLAILSPDSCLMTPACDANGNITEYIDGGGSTVAHYEYDAFGNEISRSGAEAQSIPLRFSTKYTDDETGLVYYGYRYYNSELGRWPSRDPLGEEGGLNLFVFVGNDPLGYVDPFGDVRVKKDLMKKNERMTFNGRGVWGWTFYPKLDGESAAKLKYDKKACECKVKRKPELTFSITIWVVKKGRQAWTEDARIGGVLYPDSRVYVSGALASAALGHENRRFDAWSDGLKSYFGREYEDKAASLTAPTCPALAQKITDLRTTAFAQWSSSSDHTAVLQRLIQIGMENLATARIVHDSGWRGVYVEYDLDE